MLYNPIFIQSYSIQSLSYPRGLLICYISLISSIKMSFRSAGNALDFDYLLKLVIIGDPGVGKTALLLRYIDNSFNDSYLCTIGVDFKVKTVEVAGKVVKMQIWDTAGQERFKPITKCYYRGAHGAIAVFDLGNRDSWSHAKTWVEEYKEHNPLQPQHMVVLVGNKADAEDRKVTLEEGEALGRELKCPYFEASAKANSGIEMLFETIARQAVTHLRPSSLSSNKEVSLFKVKSVDAPAAPVRQKQKKCC